MNERIRELEQQCVYWDADDETYEFDREKFAELIIQDCVRICNKVYFDNYPDAEDFERSEEGEAIKQHFGVK
jgi:hypothetical protein